MLFYTCLTTQQKQIPNEIAHTFPKSAWDLRLREKEKEDLKEERKAGGRKVFDEEGWFSSEENSTKPYLENCPSASNHLTLITS